MERWAREMAASYGLGAPSSEPHFQGRRGAAGLGADLGASEARRLRSALRVDLPDALQWI